MISLFIVKNNYMFPIFFFETENYSNTLTFQKEKKQPLLSPKNLYQRRLRENVENAMTLLTNIFEDILTFAAITINFFAIFNI